MTFIFDIKPWYGSKQSYVKLFLLFINVFLANFYNMFLIYSILQKNSDENKTKSFHNLSGLKIRYYDRELFNFVFLKSTHNFCELFLNNIVDTESKIRT